MQRYKHTWVTNWTAGERFGKGTSSNLVLVFVLWVSILFNHFRQNGCGITGYPDELLWCSSQARIETELPISLLRSLEAIVVAYNPSYKDGLQSTLQLNGYCAGDCRRVSKWSNPRRYCRQALLVPMSFTGRGLNSYSIGSRVRISDFMQNDIYRTRRYVSSVEERDMNHAPPEVQVWTAGSYVRSLRNVERLIGRLCCAFCSVCDNAASGRLLPRVVREGRCLLRLSLGVPRQ